MIYSHLNWNAEKPKFEDVEGKIVVVKNEGAMDIYFKNMRINDSELFELSFNDHFVAYAILSTDDSVCEWHYDIDAKMYYPSCTENSEGEFEFKVMLDNYRFCPYCTRPIKVITEPEVMPFMGITPDIEFDNSPERWKIVAELTDTITIKTDWSMDKESLIKSWNEFCIKMKRK